MEDNNKAQAMQTKKTLKSGDEKDQIRKNYASIRAKKIGALIEMRKTKEIERRARIIRWREFELLAKKNIALIQSNV